jgi:hypothetical protein
LRNSAFFFNLKGVRDMENSLKSKLTGWSATVGLAALAMLGSVGGGAQARDNSAESATKTATASDTNAVGTVGAAADATYQVAQSSPPPPPPPAVGAVRG